MLEILEANAEGKVSALQIQVKHLKRELITLKLELEDMTKRHQSEINLLWTTLAEYKKVANGQESQRRLR